MRVHDSDLPSGTVTLMLTDIEGSTRLWTERPRAMFGAVGRHHALISEIAERRHGRLPRDQGEGDSIFAGFAHASDGLAAATDIQLAMLAEHSAPSPTLRIRIALHTGEVQVSDGNYYGPTVNRCARLRALAHGGQTLLSGTTHELVLDELPDRVSFKDLGVHHLRDFPRPEHVWQIMHPDLPGEFPALRSDEGRADNLPVQLASFVGRTDEMQDITEILADMRLVTVTGAGGCGKTRLAVELGRRLTNEFNDGVHLVALAALRDASLMLPTIVQSVGLRESAGESPFEGLVNFLRDKEMLLILDNFEGLLEAGGVVADLLGECPDLKVLVTSRASLRLRGEHEYHLPPLDLPEFVDDDSLREVSDNEAVRLFVERARAVRPDFALTADNAAAVAEICHRLDGLPLAIELAAVRVKLLPPAALLDRLSSRLQLLTGGARDLPRRQQTLRNTIDWDYTLLGSEEQKVFRRLAICDGGFDLNAAAVIVPAAGDIDIDLLDGIESLVNKSLVREGGLVAGEPHFEMLQTLREYAVEVLTSSGELEPTRVAHSRFYRDMAESVHGALRGPQQEVWIERGERNHGNFRSALRFLSESRQSEADLALAGALAGFWTVRAYASEGLRWLAMALEHNQGSSTPEFARALSGAAMLARARADYSEAARYLKESLQLHGALGDRRGVAATIKELGNIAMDQGNLEEGKRFYDDCLVIWRELNDTLGTAHTLNNLAYVAQLAGDAARSRDMLEECLSLLRRLEDKEGIARALMNLGSALRDLGEYRAAMDSQREGLVLMRRLGDKWDAADCLEELASVLVLVGEFAPAATILGGADALRLAIGARRPPLDQEGYERRVELARRGLGDGAFEDAWDEGSSMRTDRLIEFALSKGVIREDHRAL